MWPSSIVAVVRVTGRVHHFRAEFAAASDICWHGTVVTIFLNNVTTVRSTWTFGHLIAYSEHTEANGRTIDTEEKVITDINGAVIWEVVLHSAWPCLSAYYSSFMNSTIINAHTRYLIGLSN